MLRPFEAGTVTTFQACATDSSLPGVSPYEAGSSKTDIPAGEYLVRRSIQTPPRAFEELVSEHLDAQYRTALRLTGGRHADAEDLRLAGTSI